MSSLGESINASACANQQSEDPCRRVALHVPAQTIEAGGLDELLQRTTGLKGYPDDVKWDEQQAQIVFLLMICAVGIGLG